jgi:hypothetical protein
MKLSGIFLREGLDMFLVICPSCQLVAGRCVKSGLPARQISPQRVGWGKVRRVGKAKRAHHREIRSMIDGGHVANAPLPTLRLQRFAIFGTNLRIDAASVCICTAYLRTIER